MHVIVNKFVQTYHRHDCTTYVVMLMVYPFKFVHHDTRTARRPLWTFFREMKTPGVCKEFT